jgi:hypothetical protein
MAASEARVACRQFRRLCRSKTDAPTGLSVSMPPDPRFKAARSKFQDGLRLIIATSKGRPLRTAALLSHECCIFSALHETFMQRR